MRSITTLFAVLILVFGTDCSLQASIQIQAGDYVYMTVGLGGRGGVFNVIESNSHGVALPGADEFPTFCVETIEEISLPGTYYVQSLGLTASQTGNVLTPLAARIYSDFLDGILQGEPLATASNAIKTTFNNSVQVAIWMEVLTHNPSNSTAWTPALLAHDFISAGIDLDLVTAFLHLTPDPAKGYYGVEIMNLRGSSDPLHASYNQDQLVRNAPEAASLVVWSVLAACGTIFAGRRRTALCVR